MKMTDTRRINATSAEVFAALLDPEVLKACVPGATEVTGNPTDGFEASVTQKVGPVKATFKGQVTLSDMIENQSLCIEGQGKGGAAGFAKGVAKVALIETADGCELSYDVEAKVGGKLAQLGSRIIDGFSKKIADQFFGNLQEHLEGPAEPEATEGELEEGAKKGWLGRLAGKE